MHHNAANHFGYIFLTMLITGGFGYKAKWDANMDVEATILNFILIACVNQKTIP